METEDIAGKMEDNLEVVRLNLASGEGNTLDHTVYYGHRAICMGLAAIFAELVKLRREVEKNASLGK